MDYGHASRWCGPTVCAGGRRCAAHQVARAAAWGPGMGVRQRRAVAGPGAIRRDRSVRCSVDDATDRNAGLLRGAGPVPFRHTLFATACPAEARAAHQRPNEALQLTEPRRRPLHKSISCNIICYMKRDSKLSGVLHILLHMAEVDEPVTSDTLAKAMHTNPVVIRRILAGLRKRGFVQSEKGHGGGWQLSCDLNTVTLRDIYVALGSPTLLAIGNRTETPSCLVEQAVNTVMNQAFRDAEALLLARFSEVTLAEFSHQLYLHRQERTFCRGHDETRRGRVRQGTNEQEAVQLTTKSDEQPDRNA